MAKEEYIFNQWNRVKKRVHFSKKSPNFSEGEIWWCGMGKNVGVEINGKNKVFSRPVLVFKKNGKHSFVGLPLTSKHKVGSWYESFWFQGRLQTVNFSQVKSVSVRRLYTRMGQIDESDMRKVAQAFKRYLFGKKYSLAGRLGWAGNPRKSSSIIARMRRVVNRLSGASPGDRHRGYR